MQDYHEWVGIAEGASETGEDGNLVTFYPHPVENRFKSKEQNRAIFEDKDFIRIICPGQNKSVVEREVKDGDKSKYSRAWERYQNNLTGFAGGTPLGEWAYLSPSRVMELKAQGIHAVEQLAQVPDQNLTKLGPDARDLRERAKQRLQPESETVGELRSEVEVMRQKLDEATAQLAEATRQLSEKPKRGRPRKVKDDAA
ncbi:MAG: hypothetical protein ACR2QC_04255 [Gammaproteobacteria bacterium]